MESTATSKLENVKAETDRLLEVNAQLLDKIASHEERLGKVETLDSITKADIDAALAQQRVCLQGLHDRRCRTTQGGWPPLLLQL